jgi:hypothetical protein
VITSFPAGDGGVLCRALRWSWFSYGPSRGLTSGGKNYQVLDERGSMSSLTLFGLFAVTAMPVCSALDNRNTWFILAFALGMLARISLRFPLRGLAVRTGGGYLGDGSNAALVAGGARSNFAAGKPST